MNRNIMPDAGPPLLRPSPADRARIGRDVEAIPELQTQLRAVAAGLAMPDRVAHQYQVAGGKVTLTIANTLPPELLGVGLFTPAQTHIGIGRISTGLGCPHGEADPDFLGLRLSFLAPGRQRVDFIAINDPASPTDDHPAFIALLRGSVAAARVASRIGRPGRLTLLASNLALTLSLVRQLGLTCGLNTALHVQRQTKRSAHPPSAVQAYWSGIVEVRGRIGKFIFRPKAPIEGIASGLSKATRLSADWRLRQAAGAIRFDMFWTPYLSEAETPAKRLARAWKEAPRLIGQITFAATDGGADAQRWAILASEMGADPGNWTTGDSAVAYPSSEFGLARMLAYRSSQAGRQALPLERYAGTFVTGSIDATLAGELDARHAAKRSAGHVDRAG